MNGSLLLANPQQHAWGVSWSVPDIIRPNGTRWKVRVAECVEGCSSLHKHVSLKNWFECLTATIEVTAIYGTDRESAELLEPGNSLCVPSGTRHRFRVVKPGILLESYFNLEDEDMPEPEDDIIRFSESEGPFKHLLEKMTNQA